MDIAIGLLEAEMLVGNIIKLILLELVFVVSKAGYEDLEVVKTNLPHISLSYNFCNMNVTPLGKLGWAWRCLPSAARA